MTDKIQKIREEVARIQLYTQSEVLKQVLDYIDEVQKEPVSEVWHDAQTEQPQAKKKILATNEYGACEVDYAINMALYWPKVIKWAYIEDLLKLSNVQRTTKDWREPVSEDLEEATNNYCLNARIGYPRVKDETDRYICNAFKAGAKLQKEQMMAKAIDGVVTFDYYDSGNKTYGCVAHDSFCLEDFGLKDRDKVKVIVIKED